jgi:predicted porin
MHKKLLTMAVASALAVPGIALAQSSVEVYGTINMSFGKVKYSEGVVSTTGASVGGVNKWDVANHASNYGLRGRESLGGGLTAWFQIEQNAPLERSNNIAITPASRNSAVGIQGGFGNVFMGQWTTPWADLDSLWSVGTVGGWGPVTSIIGRRETTGTAPNPQCANGHTSAAGGTVCDAIEAGGGAGHAFWRRISNSVFYQSPVMGGAQVKLAYQTNEGKSITPATAAADPSMWSASAQWAGMGGRARVGVAYDRHKDFTSVGNTDTGWAVKGGFNFGVADIGLAFENLKYKCDSTAVQQGGAFNGITSTCAAQPAPFGIPALDGDIKIRNWGIAVAVPVGTGAIRGSFAKASDIKVGGEEFEDTGSKTWNIGYEHRFSKRTSLGVGYATIKNEDASAMTWTGLPPNQGPTAPNGPHLGSDISTFFVNMTHRF